MLEQVRLAPVIREREPDLRAVRCDHVLARPREEPLTRKTTPTEKLRPLISRPLATYAERMSPFRSAAPTNFTSRISWSGCRAGPSALSRSLSTSCASRRGRGRSRRPSFPPDDLAVGEREGERDKLLATLRAAQFDRVYVDAQRPRSPSAQVGQRDGPPLALRLLALWNWSARDTRSARGLSADSVSGSFCSTPIM